MSLADALIPKRQQRILATLFLNPHESFSLSDLIRAAGNGHGPTQNILDALRKADAVIDERVGNQRRYRVNKAFPLYAELRSICVKSFGMKERLADALKQFGDEIQTAFIFGSVAKGTEHAGSDIDLFVVGDVDVFALNAALGKLEDELGREIHSNVYSPEEYQGALKDSVVSGILNGPKILVTGDGPTTDGLREPSEDPRSQSFRP